MPGHEFGKRVAWQGTRRQGSLARGDAWLWPLRGKLPPPRWPQAHTRGMQGQGFRELSGVFGAKSTIDADGYGRITPTMALESLSLLLTQGRKIA